MLFVALSLRFLVSPSETCFQELINQLKFHTLMHRCCSCSSSPLRSRTKEMRLLSFLLMPLASCPPVGQAVVYRTQTWKWWFPISPWWWWKLAKFQNFIPPLCRQIVAETALCGQKTTHSCCVVGGYSYHRTLTHCLLGLHPGGGSADVRH